MPLPESSLPSRVAGHPSGGPARQALAIGIGAFLGCLPIPGVHKAVGRALSKVTGLPHSLIGLAGRSMPLVVMLVVLPLQLEVGNWLRSGSLHVLTMDTLRTATVGSLLLDLATGVVASGLALGLITAVLSYVTLSRRTGDATFDALATQAGQRYDCDSLTLWQFANAKLRFDPVYRDALRSPALPATGTLVDVGCSQGLMLALLAAARDTPAGGSQVPRFETLVGVELRPQVARQARAALGADATIIEADAAAASLPAADAALVFDVLHLLPSARQQQLLAALFAAVRPGGALLVREAPRVRGFGFAMVERANRFKAWFTGTPQRAFHFRTADQWQALFAEAGFTNAGDPARTQGPLGNALFALRRP